MRLFLLFFMIAISSFSQKKEINDAIIRSEILIGKSIPSYEFLTGKNPQITIGFTYEKKNKNLTSEWQSILNYPTTGVSLYYTNYGTKTTGNPKYATSAIVVAPARAKIKSQLEYAIPISEINGNTLTESPSYILYSSK